MMYTKKDYVIASLIILLLSIYIYVNNINNESNARYEYVKEQCPLDMGDDWIDCAAEIWNR